MTSFAAPGVTNNLPTQLTTFVGRSRELRDVEELVASRRLVTLTGAGGCGKTRLAVRSAASMADKWPDGVWLIDLGSITDAAQLPRLTAATLGVLVEPGADGILVLAAQLRHLRLLLVLDTCEHLLEAAATLSEGLLRLCPGVSIMATSREPLAAEGEAVWRVPSLRSDEAVELFADRAALAAPTFEVDAAMAEVRAVCARVDHIPLAIELAAAWVRTLPPTQIAASLDDSFRLLTGGPRAAVPRHKALRASMAWSHALLADEERIAFRRLAVFAGTFTIDAVAAVCCGADELDVVSRLFDKSLVTVRESKEGVRYRLLDTVRQYAEEQLRAAGESEAVRDRHLDYFLGLVETAEPGLDTDQDTWRRELDSHHDNIHAALRWGLSSPGDRADRGRRLAAAMARQWLIRGQAADGLGFLQRAVDLDPADRSALQGRLFAGTAMLGMVSGRVDLLVEKARQGLKIASQVGDDRTRAKCLAMAAYPVIVDFEACQALCAEARAVAEAAGDPSTRDWATVVEAYSLQAQGRHTDALVPARLAFERSWPRGDRFCAAFARGVELYAALAGGDIRGADSIGKRVIDIVSPLGDYFAVGTNTTSAAFATGLAGNIDLARKMMDPIVRSLDEAPEVDVVGFMVPYGLLHLWDGDLDGAVRWFERGVQRMSMDVADWTAVRCLPGLVAALRRLGRTAEAQAYAATAVRLATEHRLPYELTYTLDEQARLAQDPARARDLHQQALVIRRDSGVRMGYVDSLDALADLAANSGDDTEAVRLLSTCDAARDEMGYPRPPVDVPHHEALLAQLRARLGDDGFDAAWREGAARSIDDTVATLTRGRGPRNRPQVGWDSLTPTELDVVRLLSKGRSNPEIATQLYMSRSTVKAHLSRVFAKLDVANRTELATLAASRLAENGA